MDWRDWAGELGLPINPDIGAAAVAAVLVAAAYAAGWFAGSRLGPRLARWWRARAGRGGHDLPQVTCALIRYGVAALALLLAKAMLPPTSLADIVLAVGIGAAAGLLAYHLARGLNAGGVAAGLAGGFASVAAAAGTLGGLEPLTEALEALSFSVGARRFSMLSVVNFIIVAAVLLVAARVANRLLAHSIKRMSALDVSQRTLLQKLAGLGVIVVAVLLGIDLLGIDLTALAFFSGALGLAIGFGLQKTFGNLISGLILLMDRSVKPGDVIVVGDTFGSVSKIGVRAVSVLTRDGKEHLIPNEQLMTEPVENWSYSDRNVRVHVPVGVAYGCDLALAQRLMMEAAAASARVLPSPAPSVWLRSFGESSVDHDILVWIGDPELGIGSVQSDILNRLWHLFAENNVELPYPQRDIHIRSMPAEFAPGAARDG